MMPRDAEKVVSEIASARGIKYATEEGRSEHLTDSYSKIGDIPPNSAIQIADELFWNRETVIEKPVPVKSRDGVDMVVQVLATFDLSLEVTISYEDNVPIKHLFTIQFRQFDKEGDFNSFIAREEALQERLANAMIPERKVNKIRDRIRFVTYGKFVDGEDENGQASGDSKGTKFIRCDRRSWRFVECLQIGTRLIPEKFKGSEGT